MTAPHEEYLKTVERIEPEIHPIDAAAGWASIAVSLKRIADVMEFAMALGMDAMEQEPETRAALARVMKKKYGE